MNGLIHDASDSLQKHLHDLLKDVQDQSGTPINESFIFNDLFPAFLDTNVSGHANDPVNLILSSYRDTGWLAMGQSLQKYTLQHYGSLGTTFLERILLQAQATLPFKKLAPCLGLDDQTYDAPYEGSDRLSILLGALHSQFGTTVVDTFLHPHFKKQVFIGKSFQQQQQSLEATNVIQFENQLLSRGGSIDFDYVQVETGWPLGLNGWSCSITYQLGRGTPYILHQRKGRTKKQSKLRVLYDIYNYYSRNNLTLLLHCNTSIPHHPHFRIQPNINQVDAITLAIPMDQLYEYDDDQWEDEPGEKDLNPNFIFIPADTETTTHEEEVGFLAKAILFDFDQEEYLNPSSPDQQQQQQQQQQHPDASCSMIDKETTTTTTMTTTTTVATSGGSLPSPIPLLTKIPSIRNEEMIPVRKPITENISPQERKTCLNQQTADQNNHAQKDQVPSPSSPPSPPPIIPPTSPLTPDLIILPPAAVAAAEAAEASKSTTISFSTDLELRIKASQLMDQLTFRDRERLYLNADQLKLCPNNSKGYLKNLAHKIDNGVYQSTVDHMQLEKSRAYYRSTVHFGTDIVRMTMICTSTKKTEAECKAAMAIFELLEWAAKEMNAQMDLDY